MATAPATAAVPPSALIGRRLSLAPRAPNQIAAAFPRSSKARTRRSTLVVASAAPEKNGSDVPIELNHSQKPGPLPNKIFDIKVEENDSPKLRRSPSKRYSFRLIDPLAPVRTTRQMLEAMDLVYEDVAAPPEIRRSRSLSAENLWAPWDIMEDEKEVRMRFDMPGLSKEEVKVTVEDDMLVIQGEHKKDDSQGKIAEKGTWWKERSFISYDMHILLPDYCDKKRVTAELRHGVLLINVPKMPEKKEIVNVDVKG